VGQIREHGSDCQQWSGVFKRNEYVLITSCRCVLSAYLQTLLNCGVILDVVMRSIALVILMLFYKDIKVFLYNVAYFQLVLVSTVVAYGTCYALRSS